MRQQKIWFGDEVASAGPHASSVVDAGCWESSTKMMKLTLQGVKCVPQLELQLPRATVLRSEYMELSLSGFSSKIWADTYFRLGMRTCNLLNDNYCSNVQQIKRLCKRPWLPKNVFSNQFSTSFPIMSCYLLKMKKILYSNLELSTRVTRVRSYSE